MTPPDEPQAYPEGFADPDGVAGPVTIRQDVAWGELDALGHVNHTVFLRWFENARFAWFERVGIAALMRETRGSAGPMLAPILAKLTCEYRAPVEFPDTILASVRCVGLGRSSLTLANRIWSQRRGALVAEGELVLVLLDDSSQRSTPIPEAIRAAIRACDGVE